MMELPKNTAARNNQEYLNDISRITKGAGITLVGTFVGKVLLFLMTVYLARSLGTEEVGIYFLGVTIVHTLAVFTVAGLNSGMVRYIAIYKSREDIARMKGAVWLAALICFLNGIVMAIFIYHAGEWVAQELFHKPKLCGALYWLSISIPFESLMRIFLSATRGLKMMHYTALIENGAWTGFRLLIAVILISGFDMGLNGAFMAFWISSVVSTAMAFSLTSRVLPIMNRAVKPIFEVREILRFSIPMLFTSLIYDFVSNLDVLMLGLFVAASDVGLYCVVVRTLQVGQVIFMVFQPIFQPYVAELHEKKEFRRLSSLLKTFTHWSVMFSLPVFMSLIFFPTFFLSFFGEEYIAGACALSVLAVAFIFSILSNLPSVMIFMAGRSDLSLMNNITVLVLNAALNYQLIPRFGIEGAAISTGVSFLILCIIRIVMVYQIMGVQPFQLKLWKPFTAGITSMSIVFFIQSLDWISGYNGTFFLISLFIITYLIFIFIFKLDEEQLHVWHLIGDKLRSILF